MLRTTSYVELEIALGEPPMAGGGRLSARCSANQTGWREGRVTNRSAKIQRRVQVVQSSWGYRDWGGQIKRDEGGTSLIYPRHKERVVWLDLCHLAIKAQSRGSKPGFGSFRSVRGHEVSFVPP